MEQKINIAELLKDCPKGMELDCTMYDNIVFDGIQDYVYPIRVVTKDGEKRLNLTKYGCTSENKNAKCVIFPKGKTTWKGFVPPVEFKDGDILYCDVNEDGDNDDYYKYVFILKGINENRVIAHCFINVDRFILKETYLTDNIYPIRLATEEEKQKLFDAIKENGYKWNAETKTLEKLVDPKFKVGDRIKWIKTGNICEIIKILSNCYIAKYLGSDITILFDRQDEYELVPIKFDISTLKPFESRILVRDSASAAWKPTFFGCLCDSGYSPFMTVGGILWKYCIPYEGNEHLLYKTDDCDEYYKNW